MKKTTKNIVIAIVITIILFALICVVYQQFRKQPIEQDKIGVGEVLPDANNGLDDMLDNILDSNIESNEEKKSMHLIYGRNDRHGSHRAWICAQAEIFFELAR